MPSVIGSAVANRSASPSQRSAVTCPTFHDPASSNARNCGTPAPLLTLGQRRQLGQLSDPGRPSLRFHHEQRLHGIQPGDLRNIQRRQHIVVGERVAGHMFIEHLFAYGVKA